MTALQTFARMVGFIGQSNARGTTPLASLPAELAGPLGNVYAWRNPGWENLRAKINSGLPEAALDWGPEMQLCLRMAARYRVPIFMVKHAVAGTPLVSLSAPTWNSTVASLRAAAAATFQAAYADLETKGFAPHWQGWVWSQGERDAQSFVGNAAYSNAEGALFSALRADLSQPLLKILNVGILPQIAGAANINAAKAAQVIPNVRFQSATSFGNVGDNLHFDAAAQVAVGQAAFDFFAA